MVDMRSHIVFIMFLAGSTSYCSRSMNVEGWKDTGNTSIDRFSRSRNGDTSNFA
ncbi:hypothetical protein L917_19799 [Phytophthora nicotianae]|uniref:RxLR effector protein n=1 Tax=Phytophthora nicotianae TaxID=4792 RepID=W2K382_PHYNI|nr:hypothetical protein L915_20063 [Phytophthora nicotianae]ETL79606.1 hypothetical protein L917_19799 [Phytophthora nicotianae]